MVLRPPQIEDVAAVTLACQDAEIDRWTPLPSPYGEEHARAWVEAQPEDDRVGLLVIETETEQLLGSVGLEGIGQNRGRAGSASGPLHGPAAEVSRSAPCVS